MEGFGGGGGSASRSTVAPLDRLMDPGGGASNGAGPLDWPADMLDARVMTTAGVLDDPGGGKRGGGVPLGDCECAELDRMTATGVRDIGGEGTAVGRP